MSSPLLTLDSAPGIISAIGAIGTASFGIVDCFKALPNGGPSNHGFFTIAELLHRFLPLRNAHHGETRASRDELHSAMDTLHANWINGMALTDQKAVAKSLLKLHLTKDTADHYAAVTATEAVILKQIAVIMTSGKSTSVADNPAMEAQWFNPEQATQLGRFDLALTALIDAAYQRADQRYRNLCKAWAMLTAIVLSEIGAWQYVGDNFDSENAITAFLIGFVATPLAPVAKNLSSAIANAGGALKGIFAKGTAQ